MRTSLFSFIMLVFACPMRGQDATLPPPTQHAVLTVQGRGVQIYTCKLVIASPQWVFVAPAARLFDANGIEVGSHGDGPVWHLQDGSSVSGKVVAKSASLDAGSIPWLLLKTASTEGAGKLAGVEFIRRSETRAGAPPSDPCDAGAFARVPYAATYVFYSSK